MTRTCTNCKQDLDTERAFYHQTRGRGRHDLMQPCKRCKTALRKTRTQSYKEAVLARYSPDTGLQCTDCGEKRPEVLSLMGPNGGTSRERKEQGDQQYWAKLFHAPRQEGYRVLCLNCSWLYGRMQATAAVPAPPIPATSDFWSQANLDRF